MNFSLHLHVIHFVNSYVLDVGFFFFRRTVFLGLGMKIMGAVVSLLILCLVVWPHQAVAILKVSLFFFFPHKVEHLCSSRAEYRFSLWSFMVKVFFIVYQSSIQVSQHILYVDIIVVIIGLSVPSSVLFVMVRSSAILSWSLICNLPALLKK